MKTLVVKNVDKLPLRKSETVAEKSRCGIGRLFCVLLVTVLFGALMLSLAGCNSVNVLEPTEYEADKYGYQRPKGMWISDVLVLPGMLSLENMFGESGESGILNTYAKEKDGTLNPDGTSYLVALCYGNPDAEYLKTYLRFVMVNDDGVFYDGECVEVDAPLLYGIPLESFDMNAEPDSRIRIKCGNEKMQGAIVIPFTVKEGMEGVLNAYCVLEPDNTTTDRYVDERSIAQIGASSDDELVHVDYISTGYVAADEWNGGEFSDKAVSDTPSFKNGAPCYMIMDVAYSSRKYIIGKRSLGLSINLLDDTGSGVSVESTSTGSADRTYENGLLHFESKCDIPSINGRQRVERVILRLDSESVTSHSLGLFFYGPDGVVPIGLTYVNDAFSESTFGSFDLLPLHKESTPRWILVLIVAIIATAILILGTWILYRACGNLIAEWYSGLPLLFDIEASVLAMISLALFTSLSWWIVAIAEFGIIVGVMLSAFITYSTEETFSPIITCISYAVAVIPAITAWRWWAVVLTAVSWIIVDYTIGNFTFNANKEASCYIEYIPAIFMALIPMLLIIFVPASWVIVMLIGFAIIIPMRLLVSKFSNSALVH